MAMQRGDSALRQHRGVAGRMAQLKDLRGELDVHQTAGRVFQIPGILAGILGGDLAAHLGGVAAKRVPI